MTRPGSTVAEYLAGLEPPRRRALQRLQDTMLAAAPHARVELDEGILALMGDPQVVIARFGSNGEGCMLDLMSPAAVRSRVHELEGLDVQGSVLRFEPHAPLPTMLVRRLVRARLAEL